MVAPNEQEQGKSSSPVDPPLVHMGLAALPMASSPPPATSHDNKSLEETDSESLSSSHAVFRYDAKILADYQKVPHRTPTAKRRFSERYRFRILGISAFLLCAAIAGVVVTILLPRGGRPVHPTNIDDNVDGNSGDNSDTTATTDDNTGVNGTAPDADVNNDDDSHCLDDETATMDWNAVLHAGINLTSGPMVGHTTENSANLWAYYNFTNSTTAFGRMTVLYQRLMPCPSHAIQVQFPVNQTTVTLQNLQPDTRYRFHVVVNNRKVGQEGTFKTAPLQVSKFRYMFGSCISFKRDEEQTIWNDVLAKSPEFLILNGDTVYSNTLNYSTHWKYHIRQRQIQPFSNIIRQLPVYATWDDHDYGPNDSDGTKIGKEDSLQAFQDVFANPSYGTLNHPGIHTTWSYGDVQFIVIDNRYHRMDRTTYAGPEQMEWLEHVLGTSTKTWKIVVHGGTIRRAGTESWFERSKPERRQLLDFIASKKITGVLFHGGDIHKNLFNTHPKCPAVNKAVDFEVFELVSSGLTNRGGCFTIVDVDSTHGTLPTLTYTMFEAGIQQERGKFTLLDNGVLSHEVFYRSSAMKLELNDCQVNSTGTSLGYPAIGGLE